MIPHQRYRIYGILMMNGYIIPYSHLTCFTSHTGQSTCSRSSGSVSDYPVQSSWEQMMKSRSSQSRPGSGAETKSNGGGERREGQMESSLRQRYGQMEGDNDGHMTSNGRNHVTLDDAAPHQNSQLLSNNYRQILSYTHSHTPSPSSPPPSPLTSIPRKKHSDNSKPINVAVYSAPLSPHSQEKKGDRQRPSPPAHNIATQNSAVGSNPPHQFTHHIHMQDHTPLAPRQPPSGYEQSATPQVMQQSYQLAPPPQSRPHPQNNQQHKPVLRTSSTGLTSSVPESQGHSSLRKSSIGGYGTQAPNGVAMVTHQYSRSATYQPSVSFNHTVINGSDQTPPTFSKQLSTKSLQSYQSLPHPSTDNSNHSMMSSFSSPTLPTHTQHPLHGHTPHTFSSHSHQSHNTQAHVPAAHTASGSPTISSVPLLYSPQISQADLTAVDVEAQPTPEMMLQRQPIASISNYNAHSEACTSGIGKTASSTGSYSYSKSQHSHWSGSQTSLTMSHSDSKTRRTSDSKVPQIQVDPIPSTLVTSSTRTKPTAAINEGGSSSPLRRKRMGHCRHLSLGNNIPRQRPTHARNRSLGSVNFNHILPPSTISSRQESLGNLSLLSHASSMTGSRISLTSGFPSEAQVNPQTPDPENGYDFVQHFNLFSQYTSNMALEYYTARRESSTHPPTTPPVWCMDAWNRIIVVGCGNGQIEVGVASIIAN